MDGWMDGWSDIQMNGHSGGWERACERKYESVVDVDVDECKFEAPRQRVNLAKLFISLKTRTLCQKQ